MKKVLIITYYWPPMGGGGVQRWLKFTKYLREYDWEPVIYTPLNAEISNPDPGLLEEVPEGIEVIRRPIWEPFNLYKKFVGKSTKESIQPGFLQESQGRKWTQDLSVWIRGNVFIPDAKKYWIKPSIKFLSNYLNKESIDAIISTGPPHSNHLIALGAKKNTGVKWLADFRDPWTNIDYYNKLKLTKSSDLKHRRLEQQVLKQSDEIVTVSWDWAEDFYRISGRMPKVITNGYDPTDFTSLGSPKSDGILKFLHIGSLNSDRNPHALWTAIENAVQSNPEVLKKIRIKLIGPTDTSVFLSAREKGFSDIIEHVKNMPHSAVTKELSSADILLLPLNDTPNILGVIPGKLYEYLASRRPILCIGNKKGDTARIIRELDAGAVYDFDDSTGLQEFLLRRIDKIDGAGISSTPNSPEKYSRQKLAGQIAEILNSIVS